MRSFGTELSANRRPSGKTSPELRAAILACVEAKEAVTTIAARFKVARSTIYAIKDCWDKDQLLTPKPRTGRPTILTPQDRRHIKFEVRK
jgi:transposase